MIQDAFTKKTCKNSNKDLLKLKLYITCCKLKFAINHINNKKTFNKKNRKLYNTLIISFFNFKNKFSLNVHEILSQTDGYDTKKILFQNFYK